MEWDQPRIAHTAGPCGPEATFDFNAVRLSAIEYTYQLFDQVRTPKKLVVYQGERHAIGGPAGGLGPNSMTLIAEWLRHRAEGKPMASEKVYVDVTTRQHSTPA